MLTKFYHSTVRKSIIVFGSMFNNVTIDRTDNDGNVLQTIRVPLSYAPKQKFLARIEAAPHLEQEKAFQIVLPRMAFEMLQLDYDPTRRVNMMNQHRVIDDNVATFQYAPVPYNMTIGLYIYAKNQDDGLRVIEQILPYFNPDFNVTVTAIPELSIKHDIAINLDSVSYEDDYEGDFMQRRAIVWTLMFTLKTNFYGPISNHGVIKKVIADIFTNNQFNDPVVTVTARVDPLTATPTDTYTFITEFDESV